MKYGIAGYAVFTHVSNISRNLYRFMIVEVPAGTKPEEVNIDNF